MIQVWKTLHQKDDVEAATWFSIPNLNPDGISTRHQRNPWNIDQPETTSRPAQRQDLRKYFWSMRSVEPWNSLPLDIKSAETLNAFKDKYDSLFST